MAKLKDLFNEDLFYALCKYPLNSVSYFSDQFSAGTLETDTMLQKVCDFINQDGSLENNSNQDFDPVSALEDLYKEFNILDKPKNKNQTNVGCHLSHFASHLLIWRNATLIQTSALRLEL